MDLSNIIPSENISKVFLYAKNNVNETVTPIGTTFTMNNNKAFVGTGKVPNSGSLPNTLEILMRNYLPDAALYYGLDHDAFFIGISPLHLDAQLRLDNIDDIACENIENFITNTQPLQMQGTESGLFLMSCGGNYESVLPTLDYVWEKLQHQFESELYVAVVARDLCMVCTTNNEEALTDLKTIANNVYPTHPKQVSKFLYKVAGNVWTVMEKIVP
jgi:hypothetical protein